MNVNIPIFSSHNFLLEENLMETSNQPNNEEILDVDNDHSCLLSKMIYRQWEFEANLKFANNFYDIYKERENQPYIHPEAPLHRLSDIIKKKLHFHNNDEIEEEEEAYDDDSQPSPQTHLLSDRLIELYPQIFRSNYSNQ